LPGSLACGSSARQVPRVQGHVATSTVRLGKGVLYHSDLPKRRILRSSVFGSFILERWMSCICNLRPRQGVDRGRRTRQALRKLLNLPESSLVKIPTETDKGSYRCSTGVTVASFPWCTSTH